MASGLRSDPVYIELSDERVDSLLRTAEQVAMDVSAFLIPGQTVPEATVETMRREGQKLLQQVREIREHQGRGDHGQDRG